MEDRTKILMLVAGVCVLIAVLSYTGVINLFPA